MFFRHGPGLTYASSQGRGGRNMPSYADLQMATDLDGQLAAFLATEENYRRAADDAAEEPDRAGRRRFRRPESAPGDRRGTSRSTARR